MLLPPQIEDGGGLDAGTEGRIRVERFVYSAMPDVVVVGSSLSLLLGYHFPPGFYDLSLSGHGALTGLDIILRMHRQPKLVVVETNLVARVVDQPLIDAVFSQPGHAIRELVPALRTQYRPSIVFAYLANTVNSRGVATLLKTLKARMIAPVDHGTGPPPSTQAPGAVVPSDSSDLEPEDPRLAAGLQLQLADTATVSQSNRLQIKQGLDVMARQVRQLRERDVCVLFVRMPIDPRVDASPLERYTDRAVREAFPADRNLWVSWQETGVYHTLDGVHLTDRSAARGAAVISGRVGALIGSGKTTSVEDCLR